MDKKKEMNKTIKIRNKLFYFLLKKLIDRILLLFYIYFVKYCKKLVNI